jgi:TfoX/Sxy family transcriptional regulator of competence genes
MATSLDTVQYIIDQAGLGRRLTFKKMFGEYALYLDDKVVAFICDDQLFLKPTPEGRSYLGSVIEAPPYPTAKNYFLLVSEPDDPERLSGALKVTAAALPEPRPRREKHRAALGKKTPRRTTRRPRRQ